MAYVVVVVKSGHIILLIEIAAHFDVKPFITYFVAVKLSLPPMIMFKKKKKKKIHMNTPK